MIFREAKRSGSGKGGRKCPLYSPINAISADAGTRLSYLWTFGAAGRRLLNFAGNVYWLLFRMDELAFCGPTHPPSGFSFDHEWPFSFRQDEKKMGIQSGTA